MTEEKKEGRVVEMSCTINAGNEMTVGEKPKARVLIPGQEEGSAAGPAVGDDADALVEEPRRGGPEPDVALDLDDYELVPLQWRIRVEPLHKTGQYKKPGSDLIYVVGGTVQQTVRGRPMRRGDEEPEDVMPFRILALGDGDRHSDFGHEHSKPPYSPGDVVFLHGWIEWRYAGTVIYTAKEDDVAYHLKPKEKTDGN